MGKRLNAGLLAAIAATLVLAGSAQAALIGVYRNNMDSEGQRAQVAKLLGDRCGRGGSDSAFQVTVGKATEECGYRTPVIGRDLEIAAVARLLSPTPTAVRRKAFLALDLRVGESARYQLAVFPVQRKAQLRKIHTDGRIEYLQIKRNLKAVKGVGQANQLRLSAFNFTSGPEKGSCRIVASVGREAVADFTDSAAGEVPGRSSGFSVGAPRNAKGAVASFDDVVVRVPSPF